MIIFKCIFTFIFAIYTVRASRIQEVPLWIADYHKPHVLPAETFGRVKNVVNLDPKNLYALEQYARQLDGPLFVTDKGPLTDLYAAVAPKRSFVGSIDSGYYRDRNGRIQFRDETAIGAIAV